MFRKTKNNKENSTPKLTKSRESIPTIITSDVHVLGNMHSDGAIDFSGSIDGNIRCNTLTIRPEGVVKGEIVAETVYVHGTVKGLVKAKNAHFHSACHVEGIIMHELLSIEDGAFVDGKFKRTDRANTIMGADEESPDTAANEDENSGSTQASQFKALENIRLIR
jgi:cytoskeletal protein CcmA (bactofilin family)